MISITPEAPTAASSAFLSVVVRIQILFLRKSVCWRSRRKFPLEGVGKVVHDDVWVMRFQKGHEIERAVLDLGQQRRGRRQTLPRSRASRRLSMNSAREFEDRHGRPRIRTGHADRTFLAESEA